MCGAFADKWREIRTAISEAVPCAALLEHANVHHTGNRWACPNPSHDAETQRRSPDLVCGTTQNSWVCYSCGAKGSVFDLAIFLGLASDFAGAVRELAPMAGVDLPDTRPRPRSTRIPAERALEIRTRFVSVCQNHFTRECHGAAYLAGRGISFDTARDAGLGFVMDEERAKGALMRKYTLDELMASGLFSRKRRPLFWKHPLLIPGAPDTSSILALRRDEPAPKSKGPKEYSAGEGVFGLREIAARFDSDPDSVPYILVNEGTTDWLIALSCEVPAIAVPGHSRWSALKKHSDLIPRVPLLILFDNDPPSVDNAGRHKPQGPESALNAAEAMRLIGFDATPLVPPPGPDGGKNDLASMIDAGAFGPAGLRLAEELAAIASGGGGG